MKIHRLGGRHGMSLNMIKDQEALHLHQTKERLDNMEESFEDPGLKQFRALKLRTISLDCAQK